MSKTAIKGKERTQRLDLAVKEAREDKGPIDKRFTLMKTPSTATDASKAAGGTTEVCDPTPEQLDRINQFTRRTVQANEVAVFTTLSCNDLVDRDDDYFTTDTVKEFASLPEPYGAIGKSYMVGHDYSTLPVGRIFGAGTQDIDGATFMTNEVYVPRIDANKSFLENQEFGVYWAVSVGVLLDENNCSLGFCKTPMTRWGFCYNGHDKGAFYLEDGETDSWGYPMAVDPNTPGAQKCLGEMKGAKDFYELSQVFLGAQFFAALDKTPGLKGVMKAAAASKVPILGLSRKESDALPLPHLDPRAAHALQQFGAKWDGEGILKWKDDQRLVWTFDPENSEVMCLGKAADESPEGDEEAVDDTTTTEEEQDGAAQAESDPDALGEDDGEQPITADGGADDGEGDDAVDDGSEVGEGDGSERGVGSTDADGSTDDNTNDENESEEKAVSKAAVIKSLKGLKAPSAVLSAVEGASGDSLDAALSPLLKALRDKDAEVVALTPKAALGDEYLKSLKADALDWYVRANQESEGKGVNTDLFSKMLDQCGDSHELISGLRDMQKGLAQAKFPKAVRRSTFEVDANKAAPAAVPDIPDVDNDRTVKRIHG